VRDARMRITVALCCCIWASATMAQEITIVSKPTEIVRLTGYLQRTLNELSPAAKIQKCGPVVQESAGTQDEIYGAFCSISVGRKKFRLLMCDDRMVWKFTASLAYDVFPALPSKTVVDFVRTNCPPGG
jgi:hypothetical protein